MQQPAEQAPFASVQMDTPLPTALTPRAREVAALVAEGLTNAEIAQRLVVTAGTAGNHIAHIMRVLGARSRVNVAVWAVEHGLYRTKPPRPIGRGGLLVTGA
jgi:DNA-binding NarL/FixJ family response regulator